MNNVLRILAWMLAILLMTAAANADALTEGLVQAEPLKGTCGRSDAAHQASFSLAYSYPQFENADSINRYYQALAGQLSADFLTGDTTITCDVTHHSARYVSVLETTASMGGNGETQTLRADTFALDGIYAGQRISLTQLLGLEEQAGVAKSLAYRLVWEIVENGMQNPDSDYLDGLTAQQVQSAFDPEWDYYLDQDGNIVFWIGAGEIAGEIAGVLMFPFAEAELLSAI